MCQKLNERTRERPPLGATLRSQFDMGHAVEMNQISFRSSCVFSRRSMYAFPSVCLEQVLQVLFELAGVSKAQFKRAC
jgi:hypothetical protein